MLSGLLATSTTQILLNGCTKPPHAIHIGHGCTKPPHNKSYGGQARLLQPLSYRPFKHWLSLYTDDVVLFLQPTTCDINTTTTILRLFGKASLLHTNMTKSSVTPI
jgi:hypothetical protein